MNHVSISKDSCCGCGCCMSVCPFHAIEMIVDQDGFIYPKIDENLCKNCGKCVKACSFKNKNSHKANDDKNVYAVRLKDIQDRKKSRSGGVFRALAAQTINQNGHVYGCATGKDFLPHHICAANDKECQAMRGVKYVQSNSYVVFDQIKDDLQMNRNVLFSGTPCQVQALYDYLCMKKVQQDTLCLIDLVCHGVPGTAVWKDFLKQQSKKYGSIRAVEFRDKRFGWKNHKETIYFNNGKEVSSDVYARMFWNDLLIRPSCFSCPYQDDNRIADITIGDYWGAEQEHSDMCDENGLSLCIVRTDKGKQMFESIAASIEFQESKTNAYMQPNLVSATKKNLEYDQFWDNYRKKGYPFIEKKYGYDSFLKRLKNKVQKFLKEFNR